MAIRNAMNVIRPKIGPGLDDSLAHHSLPLVGPRPVLGAPGSTPALPLVDSVAVLESVHIDARSHLLHALQLDPTAERPRVLLFLLELGDQRFAEAELIIGGLVREHPRDPEHLALYAELELRMADLPKSRALVVRALRIDPEHLEARRVKLALDVVSGEHASGEQPSPGQRLANVLERSPETAQVMFTLFQKLVEHHQLAEAARLGHALLRVQPQNAVLSNALIDLRIFGHPLGVPAYQMRRAGWLGLVILGIFAAAIYTLTVRLNATLATLFIVGCLLLVGYAWLVPALMRSWFREQGVR